MIIALFRVEHGPCPTRLKPKGFGWVRFWSCSKTRPILVFLVFFNTFSRFDAIFPNIVLSNPNKNKKTWSLEITYYFLFPIINKK